jgi:hypothetical protein
MLDEKQTWTASIGGNFVYQYMPEQERGSLLGLLWDWVASRGQLVV